MRIEKRMEYRQIKEQVFIVGDELEVPHWKMEPFQRFLLKLDQKFCSELGLDTRTRCPR